ncbi:MAG: DUF1553 domain-containing protein [Acidobacteria bacterium]|nr:DUF1553 domain-containing protein [Acidobacteriota bacterium]
MSRLMLSFVSLLSLSSSLGAEPATPSFRNDIIPAITKLGCNSGRCHGSQYGKGGFKLSLLGFDAESDYNAIVKDLKGRRVHLGDPTSSLVLRKPTLTIPHGGGLRFAVDSSSYNLLLSWIAAGVPGPLPNDPRLERVDAQPASRTLSVGESVPLRVTARFSDGSTRDVTQACRIEVLNDHVAEISPEGVITAKAGGRAAVLARYMGQTAVVNLLTPYAPLDNSIAFKANNYIDEILAEKWKQLGLRPTGLSSDTQFFRRVYLDLIGILPTEAEVRAFLSDSSPDKRSKVIDALLERSEYQDYWTLRWGDLLRVTRNGMGEKPMWNFNRWLHRSLGENRPVNAMVRQILVARGQPNSEDVSAFYKMTNSPEEAAEAVSVTFMGLRLGCAKCHQHPFEKWGQDDYYGMAAFFARLDSKPDPDYGQETLRLKPTGFVRHPKTQKVIRPSIPDGDTFGYEGDPRIKLADWLTSERNPWLARNFANRYWGYVMGRGLIEPLDDIRDTNPPVIPELLDALAKDFQDSGFDQKHLLRRITNSRAYQLDARPAPDSPPDNTFYTFYPPKRLIAEQLLDAVTYATNAPDKFPNLPADVRPIQLPDPEVLSEFLDLFGRPRRKVPCECSRLNDSNMNQVLTLMNGEYLQEKIAAPNGRVASLLQLVPLEQAVPNLYYATVSRPPTAEEFAQTMKILNGKPNAEAKRQTLEDVLWVLLNSREFLFNH